MYLNLSQLARQSYLMQIDLLTMLNALDTGTVHQEAEIDGSSTVPLYKEPLNHYYLKTKLILH